MDDNILSDIKKMLGIADEYTHFDRDVLFWINSAFGVLTQLGVGPEDGFVADYDSVWGDYACKNNSKEILKTYIYMKTRLAFDPPSASYLYDSFKSIADELEWRLHIIEDDSLKEVGDE